MKYELVIGTYVARTFTVRAHAVAAVEKLASVGVVAHAVAVWC